MAVWGFRRGLLSGLIGTAKYAVGVPVSLFVSHQYYQAVYDKLVEPKALAKVQEKIAGASGVDTFMAALQEKMQALPQALQGDFDFAALQEGVGFDLEIEAGQKDDIYPDQQPFGRCLWAG